MSLLRRKIVPIVVCLCFVVISISLWPKQRSDDLRSTSSTTSQDPNKALIVASQKQDDTTWLADHLPDWTRHVYVVDDPTAILTVAENKGHEAMVYLCFLIDNYHQLPSNMLFLHAERYQWHNDDPEYDGVAVIQRFRIPYLQQKGYVNLRCAWALGCPITVRPLADASDASTAHGHYAEEFSKLFPGRDVPDVIGVPCCAQFALTREKAKLLPRDEYVRIRDWLLETPLDDSITGRTLEYSWHMLFGEEAVHCPLAKECYCDAFGLCDLECKSDGDCEGRYTLPTYAALPKGWPVIGWNGENRTLGASD